MSVQRKKAIKNLILILSLIIFTFSANAQGINDDTKSGKYFKSASIKNFVGTWVSNIEGKELKFVTTTKKHT